MNGQNSTDIFDPAIIEALVVDLGLAVSNVIKIYIEEFTISINRMQDALVQNDYEAIARIAHSLKSSSGNLGLNGIVSLALALENASKYHFSVYVMQDTIKNMELMFKTIYPKLESYIQ